MKDTVKKITNRILNETIESKANDLMEKLKLNKSEEFDYVEEGETCEQCGREMVEGECNECGTKNEEIIYELEVDEEEVDESSEFNYAALQAKKKGKKEFELDGKKFPVKETIYYNLTIDNKRLIGVFFFVRNKKKVDT